MSKVKFGLQAFICRLPFSFIIMIFLSMFLSYYVLLLSCYFVCYYVYLFLFMVHVSLSTFISIMCFIFCYYCYYYHFCFLYCILFILFLFIYDFWVPFVWSEKPKSRSAKLLLLSRPAIKPNLPILYIDQACSPKPRTPLTQYLNLVAIDPSLT